MNIPLVDMNLPEDAKCQEASFLSTSTYIPCGAPAVAIVDNGDSRPYYMCGPCASHNVRNRRGKIIKEREPT
jgi:hypothetical protein